MANPIKYDTRKESLELVARHIKTNKTPVFLTIKELKALFKQKFRCYHLPYMEIQTLLIALGYKKAFHNGKRGFWLHTEGLVNEPKPPAPVKNRGIELLKNQITPKGKGRYSFFTKGDDLRARLKVLDPSLKLSALRLGEYLRNVMGYKKQTYMKKRGYWLETSNKDCKMRPGPEGDKEGLDGFKIIKYQ